MRIVAPMKIKTATFIAFLSLAMFALPSRALTSPPVSFARDVQPILSDKCYHCHGPDQEARATELRLDTRDGLASDTVAPGKPNESAVVMRIFSSDEDVRMPPPESKASLTSEQKELLRRWIAEGAQFTDHWAWRPPPDKVEVPAVRNESWPRISLDRFVLARLERDRSSTNAPCRRASIAAVAPR